MDDFNVTSLQESRNEWVSRLINIISPFILDGFKSIYTEAYKMCMEADEEEKYLMTFQNFISRIPKWNDELITNEVSRIVENSSCGYLEDLITCVHIIQLKALTCIRVGQKQKKVDIDIPKLKDFVHKVYILVARKLYTNIYLFEKEIAPLQIQKNGREFELIVKDAIVNAVRESIPVEQILRSYLDETTEEDVEVEETIEEEKKPIVSDDKTITREVTEIISKNPENSGITLKTNDNLVISKDTTPIKLDTELIGGEKDTSSSNDSVVSNDDSKKNIAISFNDVDRAVSPTGQEESISAPKTVERLEKIASDAAERRKLEEMEDLDDEGDRLTIGDPIKLDNLVENIGTPVNPTPPVKLDGVEVLV